MSSIISRIFVGIIPIRSQYNACASLIKIIQKLQNPFLGRSTFQTLDPKAMSTNTLLLSIILTYLIAIVATATTQISAERKI